MIRQTIVLMFLLIAAGCAPIPFQKTAPAPLAAADAPTVLERFKARMPDSFQLLTTVVFEYNWRTFAGIGTVQIHYVDQTFRVACMNPMGVKLFELSGDRGSVTTQYSIADFSKYGNVSAAVGSDIRKIYFDLVPGPGATVCTRTYRHVYRQPSGEGTLEYVFAGSAGDLIEKNYYGDDGIVWRVSYYEYRDQDGKRWPQGIVLMHYQYGYRLTIRQKELST